MTFKIGDNIIMTVDSKRGDVYSNLPDGDYQGKIIGQCDEDHVDIDIPESSVNFLCFNLNGSCPAYPGMPIRPAVEKKSENIAKCTKCNETTKNINTHKCSSQWIEGQIPDSYNGYVWLYGGDFEDTVLREKKKGEGSPTRSAYTHWQPAELPPPPPAKEVEAYGYLRWDELYDSEVDYINLDKVCRADARHFYSQPATAEVLEKYFFVKPGNLWSNEWANATIDQFIGWVTTDKPWRTTKVFFTPAAKDMLGIK